MSSCSLLIWLSFCGTRFIPRLVTFVSSSPKRSDFPVCRTLTRHRRLRLNSPALSLAGPRRSRRRQHAGRHAAADRAGDAREEPGAAAAAPHTPAVQLQHLEQRRLPATHRSDSASVQRRARPSICLIILLFLRDRSHSVHVHHH